MILTNIKTNLIKFIEKNHNHLKLDTKFSRFVVSNNLIDILIRVEHNLFVRHLKEHELMQILDLNESIYNIVPSKHNTLAKDNFEKLFKNYQVRASVTYISIEETTEHSLNIVHNTLLDVRDEEGKFLHEIMDKSTLYYDKNQEYRADDLVMLYEAKLLI